MSRGSGYLDDDQTQGFKAISKEKSKEAKPEKSHKQKWKGHPKHKHPNLDKQKSNPFPLNNEVTIKFTLSPRKIIKWVAIILLFLCVFYLGRLTVSCDNLDSSVVDVSVPEVGVVEEASPGTVSKVAGFFKSLFTSNNANANDSATGSTAVETEVVPSANLTEPVVVPVVEEPVVVEVKETVEEAVITTYTKVTLTLGDVAVDWKGTWGKIKSFQYTIKNGDSGRIKPDHFIMVVEGYPDLEKNIPLPKSSQSLKSKVIASSVATIPSGFSYSELSAGDLGSVDVTIILYDASGKEMAQVKKAVDLNG